MVLIAGIVNNGYAISVPNDYLFDFKFGIIGSDNGEFDEPYGVAYDPNNDRIIVADSNNHRVQVFDKHGNFLFTFGIIGSDNGEFDEPYGVAYDPNNDRIIVADSNNHRVQVFSIFPSLCKLTLYEDLIVSDGMINLGESITAKTITANNDINNVKFRWLDPSYTEVSSNTLPVVNGEVSDTFTPNTAGKWTIIAEVSDCSIVRELNVSFLVVPESMIGAVAVIGSSLGVLAIYRRKIFF